MCFDNTTICTYSWKNIGCGMGSCSLGQMAQVGTATGSCSNLTNCTLNSTCSLLAGAVSYWSFNDISGTNVPDKLARNPGASSGTVIINSAGKVNQSLNFNESFSVNTQSSSSLNTTPGTNWALSAWINTASTEGFSRGILGNYYGVGGGIGLYRYSGYVYIQIANLTANGATAYYSTPITKGQWYHLVGIYNQSNLMLYVNGVLRHNVAAGGIDSSNYGWQIGDLPNTGILGWNGTIDEVAVFNRVLSPSEIQLIYNYQLP
jgi:hypothetical protein